MRKCMLNHNRFFLLLVFEKIVDRTPEPKEPIPKEESKKRNVIDLSEETDSDDDFVVKRV